MTAATLHAATPIPATRRDSRFVHGWLLVLVLLVFAMVLVGGATRLTDSGLSITEWKPVHGAIPPLSRADWEEEFALYRQTSQYEIMNAGMSLGDFKSIFWWEWAHRQLGRFIGLVFAAGLVFVLATRRVTGRGALALVGLGLLLGTQGLVGWIMVASGLEPGMTAVAPVKLALHLVLACLFFAGLVAAYVRFGGAAPETAGRGTRVAAWGLVVLAFAQIALGALVAGHDAGLTYNTWPLMDGRFVPTGLGMLEPAWLNLVDNITTIQFNHRIGAYFLSLAVLAFAWAVRGKGAMVGRGRLLALLVIAQAALGIATLVHVVPIGLALAHQGLALILLLALVWNASALTAPARG